MNPTADAFSSEFDGFAGTCAILAGIAALGYSVAFLGGVVAEAAVDLGVLLSSLFLLVGSILALPALVALYGRLRPSAPQFALVALLLAVAGGAGAALHGGYDLANALQPPVGNPLAEAELPNLVDPRGLATFGFTGLGTLLAGWLIRSGTSLPRNLGTLAVVLGILLIATYVGRLVVLTPTNPLVAVPAALTGLIAGPAWYLWLGSALRRG